MPKLILFDIDGTLVLTGGAWWAVRRWVFGLSRYFYVPFRSVVWSATTVAALPTLLVIIVTIAG